LVYLLDDKTVEKVNALLKDFVNSLVWLAVGGWRLAVGGWQWAVGSWQWAVGSGQIIFKIN
jgi:hypothetical protein